jgi:LysM repeat protein/aryl-phospho-beta-D-glucosidase BglC (GH1 family)
MRRSIAAVTTLVIVVVLLSVALRPAFAQEGQTYYTVQPGDNLYRIGLKFGLSVDVLARANGIVNPNFVYVGQRLIIPAGAILPTATPPPLPTETATLPAAAETNTPEAGATEAATLTPAPILPTPTAAPPAMPSTYTVQPGDNLYRISLKFNTTMQILMQLNGLANPNIIYVGQVLKLPGGTAAPAPAVPTAGAPTGLTATPPVPASTASNVGFAYGIAAQFNVDDPAQVIDEVKELGMTWVRQGVLWRVLEPTKGAIDFGGLDGTIDTLNSNGFKVMLTVYSAPDWARTTNAESGPPTDFNDFATFVGALAAHYKGRVQAYEIWNEPNIRREWAGRPLSAASYVELLRLAYTAIKQVDSDAIVVSAGLAPTGYNDGVNAIDDRTFLRQAYAAGLGSYSDAIGAHPYGWANPPDSTCCTASPGVSGWFNDRSFYFRDTLKDYRDIMVQNGDSGTFLWATRFGWGSSDGLVTDPNVVNTNYGYVKLTNQTQQAQYVARGFELGRTLGYVGPMFLWNLNNCQVIGNQPDNANFDSCYYSLLGFTGDQRPAYFALKAARK